MGSSRWLGRSARRLLAAGVALLLGACAAVGPDYVAPELDLPDAWSTDLQDDLGAGPEALHRWWTTLDDPVLSDLIERARDVLGRALRRWVQETWAAEATQDPR